MNINLKLPKGESTMRKKLYKFLSIILAIIFASSLQLNTEKTVVHAATTTSNTPIVMYTRSTGRSNTYKSVNGAYSGYIDGASDKCSILALYDNGWCQVTYPTAKGNKTAYTLTSNFFINTDFNTSTITLGENKIVYRRSNLSQKLGTVYGTDNITIIGTDQGNTQILYPLTGGGYKCGWISGEYSTTGEQVVNLPDGWYQIASAIDTNYVIDVQGASPDNCANVFLYQNNYGLNQGFEIKRQNNGYYTIMALHSNLYLDAEKGNTSSGTNIIQYSLNNGDNQLWRIYKTADGYYRFENKNAPGMFLDCNGAVASNETNIQLWENNTSAAQLFVLNECQVNGKSYSESNSNTDTINTLIAFEESQIGVSDYKGNNNVSCNSWFYGKTITSSGYAWCQTFQSYCAFKAGIPETVIPKTSSCATAVNFFKQQGTFHLRTDNYTPKAGDLVFYGTNGSSHVGLIIDNPQGSYLQVIEGNVYDSKTGNYSVQKFTKNAKRRTDSSYVYGYASPLY